MKKIRSFSLFLALFLLFSFTSCVAESGEITTDNISTLNTEVIAQESTVAEEDTAQETETNEETTSPMIDFGGITKNCYFLSVNCAMGKKCGKECFYLMKEMYFQFVF